MLTALWPFSREAKQSQADENRVQISTGTTLSEAISIITSAYPNIDNATVAEFDRNFIAAQIGVHAGNKPAGLAHGDVIKTSPETEVSISMVRTEEGGQALLAFADPETFMVNYEEKFRAEGSAVLNATMSGRDLLRSALFIPDCDGVKLTSGTEEKAIIIRRNWLEGMAKKYLE